MVVLSQKKQILISANKRFINHFHVLFCLLFLIPKIALITHSMEDNLIAILYYSLIDHCFFVVVDLGAQL